jgi:predicted nucleotidyltransferase
MSKQVIARPSQLDRICAILREHQPMLHKRYGVRSIGIFGSWVRGTQRKKSDIDILVEIEDETITLFQFAELREYLQDLLGIRVDLVEKNSLKPRISHHVLQEVVTI